MNLRFWRGGLLALAWVILTGSSDAADLARHSPLGEVFADRPARVVVHGFVETLPEPRDGFPLRLAPRTPGYYGRQTDYDYRSYYGTAPETIFTRLPYACGFVGLC
jgi:hypothetical protein